MAIVFNNLSGGGGSKLYRHDVIIYSSFKEIYVTIINDMSSAFNTTTLPQYLKNIGTAIAVSGHDYINTDTSKKIKIYSRISYSGSYYKLYGVGVDMTNQTVDSYSNGELISYMSVVDTVTEI